MAQDLVDSCFVYESGHGGETSYPAEPALDGFGYSPVPGNLGQVWLGGFAEPVLHGVGGID